MSQPRASIGASSGWDTSVPAPPDFDEAEDVVRDAMLASPAWSMWGQSVPMEVHAIIWAHDRDKLRLSPLRRSYGSWVTGLLVPPGEFLRSDESTVDAWSRIYHEMWRRASDRYGWPEPPPPIRVEPDQARPARSR